MNLAFIIHNLTTSGHKLSDPDSILRLKVLNVFQLVFILLAPILGLFYFYIGALTLFYTAIIAGILMLPGIVLLRKTGNIILIGNYAVCLLWATISIIAWKTGAITFDGIINPIWILDAGLILLAVFLNGYLSGTVWASILFIQTGLVIYLFRTGHRFTNLIPPEISEIYFTGTFFIGLLTILLFAFLFEKEKTESLIREREKSRTIRETKRYMDEIFDRYPLPTFIIDNSHRVIQWNRACQELSMIPTEDILGKEVWDGFTINNRGSLADMLIDDMDSIVLNNRETGISKSDSGLFMIEAYLPKLKNGQRALVTAAPISGNDGIVKGAIQILQEVKRCSTEGGIQDYLNPSFPRPLYRIGSMGKIDFWNRACEDLLGYAAPLMIGKSPLIIVAKRYRPVFREMFIRVLKGESFPRLEWRYQSREGKPIYVIARAFLCKGTDGEDTGCIIENTDITDLRLKLQEFSHYAAERDEELKTLYEDYNLLKKNVATLIRKKDKQKAS